MILGKKTQQKSISNEPQHEVHVDTEVWGPKDDHVGLTCGFHK